MFRNSIFEKSDNDKKQYFVGITTHEEKIPIDTVNHSPLKYNACELEIV